ncbi:hypothetical protein [Microbispora sp. KK1-11]|uniref:hypothetical protein n=1 Tax=Microbispora sp. KK1-11 TaxID=2053005 RepID=UPI0021AFDE63|nr:hypothetical protein [Microbispora sp. KK1-11]
MTDEKYNDAFGGEIARDLSDGVEVAAVDAGAGFVEHDDAPGTEPGGGDDEALLLAAGEGQWVGSAGTGNSGLESTSRMPWATFSAVTSGCTDIMTVIRPAVVTVPNTRNAMRLSTGSPPVAVSTPPAVTMTTSTLGGERRISAMTLATLVALA